MRRACLILLLLAAASCTSSRAGTRGIEEPPQMVAAVLGRIPLGTPVEEAQGFMEREGFRCSRIANAAFGERNGLDYVYCDRTEGTVVSRRWQVALVYRDGLVVEVLASTGLVGP